MFLLQEEEIKEIKITSSRLLIKAILVWPWYQISTIEKFYEH